jgi:hypothetical protein
MAAPPGAGDRQEYSLPSAARRTSPYERLDGITPPSVILAVGPTGGDPMPPDPENDPFGPPAANTEVGCLHCGEVYDSYRIEWRERTDVDGKLRGFWCCPIPGCDGIGFGFDILPTDPNYQDEYGGWVHDGDEDWDEDGALDEPPPPHRTPDDDSDTPFCPPTGRAALRGAPDRGG